MVSGMSSIEILSQPLTLPCGTVLPNRLVKCPMQETLADGPLYLPPIAKFKHIYSKWAKSGLGMIVSGQVQVDIRFLSIAGDVVINKDSMEPEKLKIWKEWAQIAQSEGVPCLIQLASPGRMSPKGAGNRPADMPALCPSVVPLELGNSWLDKKTIQTLLGTPRACTEEDIEEIIQLFVDGAVVVMAAGFAGIQVHAAHGFLISQFLSPHTNRRQDKYGGNPENRMLFLKTIVQRIRIACPAPFCLSVKLNSGDYMAEGGLSCEEALDQTKWLIDCGLVDLIEISGGNGEGAAGKSPLHQSFGKKTIEVAPVRSSTRIRESYFADFSEAVFKHQFGKDPSLKVPIQLSGGFRSRNGMADAIDSQYCDLIGLGRSVILDPLFAEKLLDPNLNDQLAFAPSHQVKGLYFASFFPAALGLPIQFFYHNMRRHGKGLAADPDASIPMILAQNIFDFLRASLAGSIASLLEKVVGRTVVVSKDD